MIQYSTAEVAKASGATLRQMQWWDEKYVLSPHKQNHRRFYSAIDALEIMVICELRQKHLSLQKIRPMLRSIRARLRTNSLLSPEAYLITDGKNSTIEYSMVHAMTCWQTSLRPLILVSLSAHARRLHALFTYEHKGRGDA